VERGSLILAILGLVFGSLGLVLGILALDYYRIFTYILSIVIS